MNAKRESNQDDLTGARDEGGLLQGDKDEGIIASGWLELTDEEREIMWEEWRNWQELSEKEEEAEAAKIKQREGDGYYIQAQKEAEVRAAERQRRMNHPGAEPRSITSCRGVFKQ